MHNVLKKYLLLFSITLIGVCAYGQPGKSELALAITIDSAIYHRDGSIVDQWINYEVFTQRVFKSLHRRSTDWKEYSEVFKQQLRLGELLVEQIGTDGELSFVKVLEDTDGNVNLLYRDLKGDGWLDYNEMLLVKNHLNQWNIADIYFYSGGGYFSDIVATMLANENPDLVQNVSYRNSLLKVIDLFGYNQEGLYGSTISEYDSLSSFFKKQKNTQIALIQAHALQGNISEMESLKNAYLQQYPDDKSIRLVLMDIYGSLDNYEMAKVMLDELAQLIGGDEYLSLREAEILLAWNKSPKAKKVLKKIIKSESFVTDARLLLVDAYYSEQNYKGMLEEVVKVSDVVGVPIEEILSKDHYEQFYSSPDWQKWKKQNKKKSHDLK
ncbi:lipopolysaccharide assembly protein LapB [Flammeovirga sp. EKP202]|uniref:tetratricopeptide repeat protein n=1 Tax=Flammeovirga sp. EKP202 TaxID=2770592 RepID=UPI00165FC5D8|nr:hypothetical protein [Flammeovirga sp. EKP202]MBD0402638.1 hypothetical protein [Flammeovirga sp. EKP202]